MGGSSMVGSLARFVSVSTAWWLFVGCWVWKAWRGGWGCCGALLGFEGSAALVGGVGASGGLVLVIPVLAWCWGVWWPM